MNANGSDSESSDSSNEFMVAPEKLKSISPFFTKPNRKTASVPKKPESSEESDFDYENESHGTNDDLMAQVLKNLEATKKSQAIQSDQSSAEQPENTKPVKKELTNEIADLLLLGESGATASTADQDQDEPDEEESAAASAPSNYSIPKEGVKITLVDPNLIFNQRKKKKQETLEDLLKKKLNQQLRSNQVLLHKVGLLCWLAHGFYINKQINNPILLAAALKLAPKNCYPKGRVDLSYLEKITKWFHSVFTFPTGKPECGITTLNLLRRLKDKEIHNYQELVLLYVATLRALGLTCRLVISLQPPALKVTKDQLIDPQSSQVKAAKVKKEPKKETATRNPKMIQETKSPVKREEEKGNISARLRKATEARKKAAEILKRKKSVNTESAEDVKPPAKKLRSRTIATAIPVDKKGQRNSDKVKNDKEVTEKGGRTLRSRAKTADKHWPKDADTDDDDDDDEYKMDDDKEENEDDEEDTDDEPFERTRRSKGKALSSKQGSRSQNKNAASKIKKQSNKTPRRNSTARKLISSDEEDEENDEKLKKVKKAKDIWAEVYVESEENWISVSVPDAKIHCTAELYKNAADPVLYVMAWNSEGRIKDVTRRYCPHWLTVTRKQRIDEKWWLEAHTSWKEPETALTKAEDEMLKQKELEQPLPKTVSECKGHPLYVLPRHLLKFEALYPPDVVPLGYVRGEPIYSRHCVHTLRSRETWVKSARVVKPGEKHYKVVKARPKYDKVPG
ncbi:DNA repair protein complementing XP-C cells homolog isoform X2 [Diprion similis]|uniref:DNA repair protein complementing XP-C cells homolog isoform X2 n=1 Tax=Diprion similis TaxID=362088 RepID=UPI001EF99A4C|nr:DNA repair protein complementing XP-C cells homolog isoform X2 [Diprion similis]